MAAAASTAAGATDFTDELIATAVRPCAALAKAARHSSRGDPPSRPLAELAVLPQLGAARGLCKPVRWRCERSTRWGKGRDGGGMRDAVPGKRGRGPAEILEQPVGHHSRHPSCRRARLSHAGTPHTAEGHRDRGQGHPRRRRVHRHDRQALCAHRR